MLTLMLLGWLRRLFCRHREMVFHVEPERIYLECHKCGYRSPGWEVKRHV